jgi:hypothetical protein
VARRTNGWIVLARQIQDHWLWKDKEAYMIWNWLLMNANYDKSTILWKKKERTLDRGQLVTTLREIATRCFCDKDKVDRTLKVLESATMIATENTTSGRIITILNYKKFNDKGFTAETENATEPAKRMRHGCDTDATIRTIKQKNKTTTKQESFPSDEPTGTVDLFPVEVLPPEKKKEAPKTLGSFVWDAYQRAYQGRYQVPPIRNAKVNVLCSQLVKRLGMVDAVQVVGFYLTHNDRWYVQKGHALEYCVKDAEKLHMEWSRGSQITSLKAVTVERDQGNADAIRAYFAKQDEK